MEPRIQYAKTEDGVNIAYATIGEGPPLVWSAGAGPLEHPEEYRRQCELGLSNAVLLARSFADAGFSSVLEGLEDECLPGSGWAARVLPNRKVYHVGLFCGESRLAERLQERGWRNDAPVASASTQTAWKRANASLFDAVIDTTDIPPDEAADQIARQLFA